MEIKKENFFLFYLVVHLLITWSYANGCIDKQSLLEVPASLGAPRKQSNKNVHKLN